MWLQIEEYLCLVEYHIIYTFTWSTIILSKVFFMKDQFLLKEPDYNVYQIK